MGRDDQEAEKELQEGALGESDQSPPCRRKEGALRGIVQRRHFVFVFKFRIRKKNEFAGSDDVRGKRKTKCRWKITMCDRDSWTLSSFQLRNAKIQNEHRENRKSEKSRKLISGFSLIFLFNWSSSVFPVEKFWLSIIKPSFFAFYIYISFSFYCFLILSIFDIILSIPVFSLTLMRFDFLL